MRSLTVLFLVALVAAAAVAEDPKPPFQNYELTDEEIAKALEGEECPWSPSVVNVVGKSRSPIRERIEGTTRHRSKEKLAKSGAGLLLLDSKSDNWAASIYIRVLTPYAWICEQAKEAERRFMPLTVEDVTEDMKRPVLWVKAYPGKILCNARKNGLEKYGMTHVTIRSTAKKDFEVLEPVSVEEEMQTAENIDERKTHYPELTVIFDMEQVAEISKLDDKGEIFVVLTNSLGKERKLKIKTKHFKKLP